MHITVSLGCLACQASTKQSYVMVAMGISLSTHNLNPILMTFESLVPENGHFCDPFS